MSTRPLLASLVLLTLALPGPALAQGGGDGGGGGGGDDPGDQTESAASVKPDEWKSDGWFHIGHLLGSMPEVDDDTPAVGLHVGVTGYRVGFYGGGFFELLGVPGEDVSWGGGGIVGCHIPTDKAIHIRLGFKAGGYGGVGDSGAHGGGVVGGQFGVALKGTGGAGAFFAFEPRAFIDSDYGVHPGFFLQVNLISG